MYRAICKFNEAPAGLLSLAIFGPQFLATNPLFMPWGWPTSYYNSELWCFTFTECVNMYGNPIYCNLYTIGYKSNATRKD